MPFGWVWALVVVVWVVCVFWGFVFLLVGGVFSVLPIFLGGILGRRGIADAVLAANGIKPIDMVVVNLYPFEQTVANPNCDLDTAIENIDIGGPSMIRGAAKNHNDVAIVVDPADYETILAELQAHATALTPASNWP